MVLITGATGFLGKYIVRMLYQRGYHLRLLVRNAKHRELNWLHSLAPDGANGQDSNPRIELIEGDVTDITSLLQAVKGVSEVVHAAAVVSFWKKQRQQMFEVNVKGTANVVDICLETSVERLIHVSSIAALGKSEVGSVINEDTPWKETSHTSDYAKTKYLAELEVYRGVAEGLHATMINPGVILGEDTQWSSGTPKLFSIVDKGLTFYNRASHGIVGAVDVAESIALLLNSEVPVGERFILVAKNMSQKQLFQEIAKGLGKKAPTKELRPQLSMVAGYVSEWWALVSQQEPIITIASMRSAISSYKYDGTKLLQYGFSYTPVEKVIADSAKKYLTFHVKAEDK